MRYKYTATNTEGKSLTGIINAADEPEAREKLNHLGFSILKIQEAEETEDGSAKLEKFEFEASDKNGKRIKGSIPSESREAAYKRLIEEYRFTIQYLAPASATEGEKTRYRLEGVDDLVGTVSPDIKAQEEIQEAVETPEFLLEKEALLTHVDGIIEKIHTLLANFGEKISPEKKALIESDIDKLMRIKSSNNLDYIRNTCKELLKKTQEEEIFLTGQEHEQERNAMVLESQKLMVGLNRAAGSKTDLGLQIKAALAKLEEKLGGGKFEFLLEPVRAIKESFTPNPELLKIKTQLKSLRTQEITALKIAFKSPKETRSIAFDSFKKLWAEEKALRAKIRVSKQLRHEQNMMIRKEREIYFIEEINTFTGWLLLFYLIYYFLGHYVTTTRLALDPLLGIPFDLGDSVLFKYLLVLVFLIHTSTSVKLSFFIRSRLATYGLGSLVSVLFLMVLFNF
jgi:hypothetical protein